MRGLLDRYGADSLHAKVMAWRESVTKEIEITNTLLSACRHTFSEGYGPDGWLICDYVDVLSAATIENHNARNESELPWTVEEIKEAILEVGELNIIEAEDETTLKLLRTLYSISCFVFA